MERFLDSGNLRAIQSSQRPVHALFPRRHRDPGLIALSLYPGAIQTNLQRDQPVSRSDFLKMVDYQGKSLLADDLIKSILKGAATHIVAAFDPKMEEHPGSYLHKCAVNNKGIATYAKTTRMQITIGSHLQTCGTRLLAYYN